MTLDSSGPTQVAQGPPVPREKNSVCWLHIVPFCKFGIESPARVAGPGHLTNSGSTLALYSNRVSQNNDVHLKAVPCSYTQKRTIAPLPERAFAVRIFCV